MTDQTDPADRIEELEAKLAKAVDTLENVNECMFSASLGEYELTRHIEGALERKNARVFLFQQTRTTLAELKGEDRG